MSQLKLIRTSELYTYFSLDSSIHKRSDMIETIFQTYSPDMINEIFKTIIKHRFKKQWLFLKQNHDDILEIDYQWFYKNQIEPSRIYK